MRFQQDLQVMVRERQRRLLTEHFENSAKQILLVTQWIASQPALVAILKEAAVREPDLDYPKLAEAIINNEDYTLSWQSSTEEGQATIIWTIMEKIASHTLENSDAQLIYTLGHGNYRDTWKDFAERVLAPLFDYLLERLTQYSSVLHTLERYVHIVEWFNRDDLYSHYLDRRATGEEVYNDDLQRFLYTDGGFVTHAKVRSASGEADLTGGIDSADPLICEGKLFDSRGVAYLAKGVHQVVKYAHDYRKTIAYLVIFNQTDKHLHFDLADLAEWPPRLVIAGVRVNFVVVRAKPPQQTASKSGKATVVNVTAAMLLNPDLES